VNTLLRDFQYGLRMLRRAPGFATVAVLTLALGIGANTAIFTVINAVMLRMLPVQDPEQLVTIGNPAHVSSYSMGTPRTDIFSYPLYREIRDHNQSFSSLLATSRVDNLQIIIDSAPEKISGRLVTGNYFETLGVNALLGRTFTGAEDRNPGSDPVVVISYGYWQKRFSGDSSVVGRTVRLKNYPMTIVGVAPPGFFGEVVGVRTDVWVPMMMQPQMMPGRDFLETPNTASLLLIGRLKPGVSVAQARDDVNRSLRQALTVTLAPKLSADDRAAIQGNNIRLKAEVEPGGRGLSRIREDFSGPLLLLMAMVGLVLLVACVNVANLMLARSAARQREIAVRLAIGAGRFRIVRQLMTESVLLALLGGGLGLLLAHWGARALIALTGRAPGLEATLDLRVLAFTGGACLLSGIVFGLAPAMRFMDVKLSPALKEGGRDAVRKSRNTAGRTLITAQVALGVLVLMASGLLIRSLQNLQEADLGYSREQLLLARVDAVGSGYKPAQVQENTRQLLERFSALPGVRSVTASSNGLFSGTESSDVFRVEGSPVAKPDGDDANDDQVGPNYFSTIGVPIVLGRDISQQDYASGAKVAVVNEAFAKYFFPDRSPIGHKVNLIDSDHPNLPPLEIVGVARDVHDHNIRNAVPKRVYAPLTGAAFDITGATNFELRAVGNPAALTASVREAIRAIDPNLVIDNIESAGELVTDTLTSQILVARLSLFFAGLVLVLVCVGLYGTMSYGVVGRTKEIGVRMALGARRWDVVWMVTREACLMLAIGVLIGIPAGVLAIRLFRALLFQVTPADPISIAASIATLFVISFAAAVIPARRATRIDPMVALRYE
jgi:predicted permease